MTVWIDEQPTYFLTALWGGGFRFLVGAIGGAFENIFRVPGIVHGRLHVLDDRVRLRTRGRSGCFFHMLVRGRADRLWWGALPLAGRNRYQQNPHEETHRAICHASTHGPEVISRPTAARSRSAPGFENAFVLKMCSGFAGLP